MTTIALNGLQLNLGELEKARNGKITHHKCAVLSGYIKKFSNQVEKDWDTFSEDEKDQLIKFAYKLADSGKPSIWTSLRVSVAIFRAYRDGYHDGMLMVASAINELVDSIFSAIERENPEYNQVLLETLDELIQSPEQGEQIKPEEVGGWLRSLSNQALEEI